MVQKESHTINRRKVLKALAVTGAASTFGATVAAKEGSNEPEIAERLIRELEEADNPDKKFERFSDEEQKTVADYLSVTGTEMEVSNPIQALDAGCTAVTATLNGTNSLGSTLWTYEAEVVFCYDGSTVSNITTRRSASSESVGWSFDGHIEDTERGGAGRSSYSYWTQGEFSLCLTGDIGCVQFVYPWVEVEVFGNGAHNTDGVELSAPIPIPY
jgi:hypothetical protein